MYIVATTRSLFYDDFIDTKPPNTIYLNYIYEVIENYLTMPKQIHGIISMYLNLIGAIIGHKYNYSHVQVFNIFVLYYCY